MNTLKLAVIGATGAVGRVFLQILEQQQAFEYELGLFASYRSAGKEINHRGIKYVVEETNLEKLLDFNVAFVSVSSSISKILVPQLVNAGITVIDDSSAFRMNSDVPLVVPEINAADLEQHHGIVAIPNCSTTQLVMVLHPLIIKNKIKRVIVDTYQAVSGAGSSAITELKKELTDESIAPVVLPQKIAFNVIPQIEDFLSNGYSKEEEKMDRETRKILHDSDIKVSATCVRVPVIFGHSEAVHIDFEEEISVDDVRDILSKFPGITLIDNLQENEYPMPLDVAGKDDVFVGRIRKDVSNSKGIVMWIVSDNLRKGASLNAIQILKAMIERKCLKANN